MSHDGGGGMVAGRWERVAPCAYCGRQSHPANAHNCCGCGAPLVPAIAEDWIDVTTCADREPVRIRFRDGLTRAGETGREVLAIPTARPLKK